MAGSLEQPPADLTGAALRGPHRALALGGDGPAVRYRPEVSAFASLGPEPTAEAWAALAELPGEFAGLTAATALEPQAGWVTARVMPVLQLTGREVSADEDGGDRELEPLTEADVPEMLELVARTRPGPFLPGTIAFGGYVGIRREGALVAMAGRRMRAPGWIEVSAVCTDPAQRGAGLGRRVTAAVVRGIRAEGDEALLHVLPENPARRLYEAMGFVVADEGIITVVQRTGQSSDEAPAFSH